MHLATDNTKFWQFIADWQTTDFYKYNPINDESKLMDYEQYRVGRLNGSIPAPDPNEVHRNTLNPLHVEHDGA